MNEKDMLQLSELPIIQAPMAGGPSTPALAAGVIKAGGFGFVAAGYLTVDELRQMTATTRSLADGPFGVNLFVPSAHADAAEVAAMHRRCNPRRTD
jgi:nitronate monooxygenase